MYQALNRVPCDLPGVIQLCSRAVEITNLVCERTLPWLGMSTDAKAVMLGRPVDSSAPVAVIIPTYNRGVAILSVLEKIQACNPKPAEIWVHVDLGDGVLEREVQRRFPDVGILTSATRLGPGGGRHRCLLACTTPYAVSFDDDSYPVDPDFFSRSTDCFPTTQKPRSLAPLFGIGTSAKKFGLKK